jgi:hypothetical protein
MQSDVEMELVNEFGIQELHIRLGGNSALLEAAEVDRLIEQLGLLRCEMSPEVTRSVSREDRYAVELQPRWRAIPYPMINGVVLFLRHGGFGWTGFAIPPSALDELLEMVTHPPARLGA